MKRSKKDASGKPVRLQFEVSADKKAEMEALMRGECGIHTTRDLVGNALTLFFWAIRESKRGRIITSMDEVGGTYKQVILPCLELVAPSKNLDPKEVQ